jgi:hypothetical protein
MKGPTLGCAASVSSASRRLAAGSAVVCAAMLRPRKVLASVLWYCGSPHRLEAAVGVARAAAGPEEAAVVGQSGQAQLQPVNTAPGPRCRPACRCPPGCRRWCAALPSGLSSTRPMENSCITSRAIVLVGHAAGAGVGLLVAQVRQVDAHHRVQRHRLEQLAVVAQALGRPACPCRRPRRAGCRPRRRRPSRSRRSATARRPRAGAAGPGRRPR